MGYRLVIAEKPNVAENIAKAIGATKREKTEKGDYWSGNGYIVVNCLGHLVKLSDPEGYDEKMKKWSFETLPFFPDTHKFEIIPETKQQFSLVKSLMLSPEVDEIIVATDAGREGCAIYGYIAEIVRPNKPEKRLWVSSMTDEAIREGMKNLKDNSEYRNMYIAALYRALADSDIGINFSRYYTLRLGGYKNPFNTGRVQTVSLANIVDRENNIRNFVSEKFYEVHLITPDGIKAKWVSEEGKTRISTLEKAEEIRERTENRVGIVAGLDSVVGSTKQPLLYNLNDLQREGNRRYGYTAKQVLDVIQKLYEKRIVTYPRTDSRYLTTDMIPKLMPLMERLLYQSEYCEAAQDAISEGLEIYDNIIDNSKVTDHHAIIFTENIESFNMSTLSLEERNVLNLIIVRFMETLSRTLDFEETKCKINVDADSFHTNERKVLRKGFIKVRERYLGKKAVENEEKEEESCLDKVVLGGHILDYEIVIRERQTSPPKPYTEDTLLQWMEKPYPEMKLNGFSIGTPATRAETIEALIRAGYVVRKGKSLHPLPKGEYLIEHVDEGIKNPYMTAHWERELEMIADGKFPPERFIYQVEEYVREVIEADKTVEVESEYRDDNVQENEVIGTCPICGFPVRETKYGWCCKKRLENKEACSVNIGKEDRMIMKLTGKKLSKKQAETILSTGKLTVTNTKNHKVTLIVEEYCGYIKWKFEEGKKYGTGRKW